MNLDFTSEKLQNEEGLYILTVRAKENMDVSSGDIGIKRITGTDAATYAEGLNELKAEVSDDSPINKVIYASFYEENGLILDALTKMEEAIQMSPEVTDFEELKKDILERNGIKIFEERDQE